MSQEHILLCFPGLWLQTPFVLSGQRLGLLLRSCHCHLCQKRVHWGVFITSTVPSWIGVQCLVVPPSLRALWLCSDQYFCVFQRWNFKHLEKSRSVTKGDSGFETAAWESWDVNSGFGSAVCSASSPSLLNGAIVAIQEEVIRRCQGSVSPWDYITVQDSCPCLDPMYSVGFLKSLLSCCPAAPLVGLILICQNNLYSMASAFPCVPHAPLSPCP